MIRQLAGYALVSICLQWFGYVFSAILKTEKFYDATGSCTILLLIYMSTAGKSILTFRQKVQNVLVVLWTVRLGSFLFFRIVKEGRDRRFNRIKKKPHILFIVWNLQGIWAFMTLLPTFFLNAVPRDRPLCTRDYVGWSIWLIGFTIEVVADFQKMKFRSNPKNSGKFITTGLWHWSRHPNYFGEILLWCGLYISASSVLRRYELLCVLSPVFNFLLITRVSGIPLLEKNGLRRWGHLAAYHTYIEKTPKLIPFLW